MITPKFLRNRFTDGALDTASPASIVVMAYDRLERDLTGALEALDAHDLEGTNNLLGHAQDLVAELDAMLDLECWEHASALSAIYQYVGQLLTKANINKAPEPIAEAKSLLADMGSAFREAATAVTIAASAGATSPSTAQAGSAFGGGGNPGASSEQSDTHRHLSLKA